MTVHGLYAALRSLQERIGLYTENGSCPNTLVRILSPPLSLARVSKYETPHHKTVIEAEVHYAIRHEYAQTALDVLARRTRLSFLNARAALQALPRVIDIMSEELGWTRQERIKQIKDTIDFLVGSMGLDEGYVLGDGGVRWVRERLEPRGWVERGERNIWWIMDLLQNGANFGSGKSAVIGGAEKGRVLGRARFEVGEVGVLKSAFDKYSTSAPPDGVGSVGVVPAETKGKLATRLVLDILKQIPGYEGITRKELEYILEEAGFKGRQELDWEEFLEVSGGLREVNVSPAEVSGSGFKREKGRDRRVIPVEKSGGGV